MERARDCVGGRQHIVELRKGIERLLFGLVKGKGKRANRNLFEVVLDAFRIIEFPRNNRAVECEARRCFSHALQAAASNPKYRQRIIKFEVELIAAPASLN